MFDRTLKSLRGHAAQPARFILVGGLATGTHLIVAGLILLMAPGVIPYLVNFAAFLAAFLVSFYGHRHITFRVKGSMKRFFVIAAGGFALNNLILTACLALSISSFISICIATSCVPVLTYLASSFWAFK